VGAAAATTIGGSLVVTGSLVLTGTGFP